MDPLRFPGETDEYRKARDALTEAERGLRRQIEQVAALRRGLPPGGRVPQDYPFRELGPDGVERTVRLSELFGDKPSLLLYSFMFGPADAAACPMCNAFIDGLDGDAPHVQQRASLAIVAKAPIARFHEHGRRRGWRNLRLLSSAESSYNVDYHGETADGGQDTRMNVFARREGSVFHFYGTELEDSDPGQNSRHLDLMWPLWGALDLTPEGRGKDWYPKLAYPPPS